MCVVLSRHSGTLSSSSLPSDTAKFNFTRKKKGLEGAITGAIMAMGEIKYDDYTEEEQALMKGAPYVMKPLQGQDDAACHRSVGV